eukprot:XP_019925248.1 PREDICTED: thromboxane A2 receptor-like [Crassostrea gigas]
MASSTNMAKIATTVRPEMNVAINMSTVSSKIVSEETTTSVYENAGPVTILFILGALGNAVAVGVLCCNVKTHKWRPFHRFLFLMEEGSFAEYRYISEFKVDFSKPVCDYVGFVFMFTLMSSAMIVCCMSLDRFFATFYPFQYNSPSKGFRTNVILAIVWCLSGILSSLHLYGLGSSRTFYPGSWCFLNFIDVNSNNSQATQNIIYSYIYALTGLAVLLLMVGANTAVVLYFLRNRCILKKSTKSTRDLQIIIFLLIIVVVFTSLWSPLMIIIIQHASGVVRGDGETELVLLRMGVTNSVLDPWIYIFFRKEILILLLRAVEMVTRRKLSILQKLSPNRGVCDQRTSFNR